MSKVIAHIDLNAFFASVEQIEQPELKGKPIAVGGNGQRGMIVTASYEARAFGVKAGMPTYQAKALCPHLMIIGHHFEAYHDYSHRFKQFIERVASKVEMGSIDECYADFSHIDFTRVTPEQFFLRLQHDLLTTLHLPSSWGIAPTKFLAKMASDLKKPMGMTFLRKRDIKKLLYPLPVEAMYGIGKKTYPKLIKQGITTIGDLIKPIHEDVLRFALGKFYFTVKLWLNGEGDDVIDNEEHDPKSIGNSATLDENTADYNRIQPVLQSLIEEVYERAKKRHLLAKTFTVTIKQPNFKVSSRSVTLDDPVRSLSEFCHHFYSLFKNHFSDVMIRLVGVSLHQLVSENILHQNVSIFDTFVSPENHNKTQEVIESINRKLKKNLVKRASDNK